MYRLEGKVALITGGGAGIGRASSLLFSREGATVVIAERDRNAGEETAALINQAGEGKAIFIPTDVTEGDGVTSKSMDGQLFGLVQPDDIAYAALYLASDESKSTTGHILVIDGGLTIS